MSPENFLMKIWNDQEGRFFCLTTKSLNGRWREFFFEKPFRKDIFKRFIEMRTDQNLYFCPHGFTENKRQKEFAASTSYLWADLDEVDPQDLDLEPQVAWESSPNRYAALWKLNRSYGVKEAESKNKTLTYAIGADKGGWDFTQVLRIPGTFNYKYKDHPQGKLLWTKPGSIKLSDIQLVDPVETLSSIKSKIKPSVYTLLTAKRATVGKRSDVIWKLENELREAGLTKDQIFILIKNSIWNKFKGRNDEDRQLRRELNKIGEEADAPLAHVNGKVSGVNLVCLDDVEVEDIKWLWYPYIPKGKVTLIEGDPGLGKSWVTTALASYISNGRRLPEQAKSVTGKILILSAEDGMGDTVKPRLDQLDADTKQVFALEGAVHFSEDGSAQIEEYIQKTKPDLMVIDPLVAYMGGDVDLHKANETREIMVRLALLAAKYGIAILGVRHLTKGVKDKSIYRGLGSIDLTAAARSVILVGRNPDDPIEGRVLCHIKSNLAPMGQSITYSLSANRQSPFKWGKGCGLTAKDIMDIEPSGSSEREMAKMFLLEKLKDEGRKSSELKAEAEAKGISVKTLISVKRELKLEVTYIKEAAIWSLPSD